MTTERVRLLMIVVVAGSTLGASIGCRAETVGHVPLAAQQQILASPGTTVAGPANAASHVVEYFDYNCGYCRRLAPQLAKLREDAPQVSITYKEWPILGKMSVYAAKHALAAQFQGKYLKAHDALISAPRLTQEAQVDEILHQAGIDLSRLNQDLQTHAADIDALLQRNDAEASALGIRGTPGLLIGHNVEVNIADEADLKAALARDSLAPAD